MKNGFCTAFYAAFYAAFRKKTVSCADVRQWMLFGGYMPDFGRSFFEKRRVFCFSLLLFAVFQVFGEKHSGIHTVRVSFVFLQKTPIFFVF